MPPLINVPSRSAPAGYNPSYLFTLSNPNPDGDPTQDRFGLAVASYGDIALVGAPYEGGGVLGADVGKVYVYNTSNGQLIHTISNPRIEPEVTNSDLFGESLSMNGTYAVIGSRLTDQTLTSGYNAGKAYIYDVSNWQLVHTLDNPNAYAAPDSDFFGKRVAIDGDYVAVSAFFEDDASGNDSGKVYIFQASTGSLLRTLSNPNAYGTSASDRFGEYMDMKGGYLIAGAADEDDANGTASGKAYIFEVATGNLLHTLHNPNPYGTSASDTFGRNVAISDQYALVAAPFEDSASVSDLGNVYVYSSSTGALLRTIENPNIEAIAGDYFGEAMVILGNYAFISAMNENYNYGKLYIFKISTGELQTYIDFAPLGSPSKLGTSLAIGNKLVAGGPNYSVGASDTGRAVIYKL